jgi:hypothetical protein
MIPCSDPILAGRQVPPLYYLKDAIPEISYTQA